MESNHTYDLFGVRIHLVTDSFRISEEARMFLGAHEAASPGGASHSLVFEESATMPAFDVPQLRRGHGKDVQIIEHDRRMFFSVAEGMACYNPKDKACHGYVFPRSSAEYSKGTVPLIHLVVLQIMFEKGFLPLHGSAVDCHGQALILSGEKGAGKSTLALKLHRLGFPLICDDLLYLRNGDNGLLAGGHCQAAKIKTAEAGFLQSWCEVAEGKISVPGKTLFCSKQINSDAINRLYPVRAVVFLKNAASRGEAIVWGDREMEVFQRLLGDTPLLNTPDCRARALELFCGTSQCRFCLAQTSMNPDETADEILNALNDD
jgi:hypothetical protein